MSTIPQRDLYRMINEAGDRGEPVVVATVAHTRAEAKAALRSGESKLHHFSLTADEASEEGMVCGGTMDIFVEVL
jgi:xanthine dehydrogenase accessory factor